MEDVTVTVTIPGKSIEAAINKAGKLDPWRLDDLARRLIDAEIKRAMKKSPAWRAVSVSELVNSIDWNKVIKNRLEDLILAE